MNCADDDLRDGEGLEGVTPPTPWREFIEAFRSSVGVDARASRLIEEELRRRGKGLGWGAFPFGDDAELVRCPSLDGEAVCGEEGRAVDEAVLIESRFSECERVASLFVDGGNGGGGADFAWRALFGDEYAIANTAQVAQLHRQRRLSIECTRVLFTQR